MKTKDDKRIVNNPTQGTAMLMVIYIKSNDYENSTELDFTIINNY